MSDMGEDFKELKKISQAKRERNRESSSQLLREAGISFVEKNNGAHLIVNDRYDFWPGTGLWMARGDKTKQRGVMKLIKRIKG